MSKKKMVDPYSQVQILGERKSPEKFINLVYSPGKSIKKSLQNSPVKSPTKSAFDDFG